MTSQIAFPSVPRNLNGLARIPLLMSLEILFRQTLKTKQVCFEIITVWIISSSPFESIHHQNEIKYSNDWSCKMENEKNWRPWNYIKYLAQCIQDQRTGLPQESRSIGSVPWRVSGMAEVLLVWPGAQAQVLLTGLWRLRLQQVSFLDEGLEISEVLFLLIRSASEVIGSSMKVDTSLVSDLIIDKFLNNFRIVCSIGPCQRICIQILHSRCAASRRCSRDSGEHPLIISGGFVIHQLYVVLPAWQIASYKLAEVYIRDLLGRGIGTWTWAWQ